MKKVKVIHALRNSDFAKKILDLQNPKQIKEAFQRNRS